ncbi:MAG: hypothetical protein RBR97_18780 [Bacteroidales bacterium]|nr:hypothetical protein [Bacteroidales bacterium]
MLVAENIIEKLINELIDLETTIIKQSLFDSVNQAKLKIQSGKLLNQMFIVIKQQGKKWEIEAPKIFIDTNGREIIKKTSRCERMKVAKIIDIEDYIHLGWAQLALLSTHENEKIDNLLIKYSLSKQDIENKSEIELKRTLNLVVSKKLLIDNKLIISDKIIKKAIINNFKIDKKIINKLRKYKDYEKALVKMIDYDCIENNKKIVTQNNKKLGSIEEKTEQLTVLLKNACNDHKSFHIPNYMIEDLVHYALKLLTLKNGKENADIPIFNNGKVFDLVG